MAFSTGDLNNTGFWSTEALDPEPRDGYLPMNATLFPFFCNKVAFAHVTISRG